MAQPVQYIVDGDLLRAREQVIVNPVNCQGIMGRAWRWPTSSATLRCFGPTSSNARAES